MASSALSRLCALGLPKLCDWLQANPDALERPAVDRMVRDVLGLTAEEMGYRFGLDGPLPRDTDRRDATRTGLLLRWATDPRYTDPDTDPDTE